MSSTQDDTNTTPAPEQADSTAQPSDSSEPAAEPTSDAGAEGETAAEVATSPETSDGSETEGDIPAGQRIVVEVEMMLYEAGMIANSLSSKALGSSLADKLFAAEQTAEGEGESRFNFSFTPFEAGMALGSMGRVVDGSLDRLKNSLGQALGEVMEDLNIPPLGDQGGTVGGGL